MSKSISTYRAPTEEEIAICAHRIYESEGRPQGKSMEHWLQAEAQLIAERKAEAASMQQAASQKPRQTTPAPAPAPQRGNNWQQSRQTIPHN